MHERGSDVNMVLETLQPSPPKTDLFVLNDTNRKYLRKRKSDVASTDLLKTPSSGDPLRNPTADTPLNDVSRKRKSSSPLFLPCKTVQPNIPSRFSSQKGIPEPPDPLGHDERLALVGQVVARTEESHGNESIGVVMKPEREDTLEGSIAGFQALPIRPRIIRRSRVLLPERWFESPLINLLVGPSVTASSIHRELASNRSETLRKRLSEPKMEIILENVNPKVFKHWKERAYGNENLDGYDIKLLYQLFFLASDLKSRELQDLVLDQIKAEYHKLDTWPNHERIVHVYRNTTIGSPLRRFVVKSVYYRLMVQRENAQTYFGRSDSNDRFIRDYVEFVQEVQYPKDCNDPRLEGGRSTRIQDIKDSTSLIVHTFAEQIEGKSNTSLEW